MITLYFKTEDGCAVGTVREVPLGRGLKKARWAMRVQRYIEISETEYYRLKAKIEQRRELHV